MEPPHIDARLPQAKSQVRIGVKRSGTIIVTILVLLSLLGGRFGHGEAHDCTRTAFEAVHLHASTSPGAESHAVHHAAASGMSCDGLFCPMSGCCFPRTAAHELGTPPAASSALPLLLAVQASGTGPGEVDHPPQIS